MITFGQFLESNSIKLAICDIQPEHAGNIVFDMRDFCKFAMTYPEVYVLYNGPELGYGNASNIARWYNKFGIPFQVLQTWKWYEKNYAWFRDLMDQGCWHRDHLIRLARFMIMNRKWDWRNLTKQDFRRLKIPDMTIKLVNDYHFAIPDLAFRIRRLDGADICGGGVNECLDEVMILAEAMKVKLNILHDWTY